MAAPVSTRDLSKAVSASVLAPGLPLPEELNQVIARYLERHEKYDDGASDRLQEELTLIYNKSVTGHPARYATFLAILRLLRPALRTRARIVLWWDRFIEPVLENLNVEKGLAAEALQSALELLAFEEDGQDNKPAPGGPNIFADRLLSRWMHLNALKHAATGSGSSDSQETFMQEAIMVFGKKDPKTFLVALNSFFVKKEFRNRSLNLLCEFVQSQPPHLHLVMETPLFDNILKSLQQDESTTTVSLDLVSLFMLLPNMPSSLVPYLPTLFNVYARLLFWDRDRSFAQEHTQWGAENDRSGDSSGWEKCLFDNDLDGDSIHHLATYFTILYGLYPLNFVDYIRKPQRYLRHANNTDDIDVQAMEIRDRSERFRRCHLLHPNFYQLTVDSEKTDFSRWIRSEPAEVITDCMNLCIPTDAGAGAGAYDDQSEPPMLEPTISPPDDTPFDESGGENEGEGEGEGEGGGEGEGEGEGERSLLSRMTSPHMTESSFIPIPGHISVADSSSINDVVDTHPELVSKPPQPSRPSTRNTSTRASLDARPRDIMDSPTLPPHLIKSSSHSQLQDMINSNKVIKSGLHQLANDSVPSLALSHTDSLQHDSGYLQIQGTQRSLSTPSSAELANQLALLQRQNLLLQNDLNFERYMKQQHMTHVGALRRKQLREAATEAETQNLVMANRSMKYRLEESKRNESQIRKEAEHRRNIAKKWESSQSEKLRHLRDLQKKWTADETLLKSELESARAERERLRIMVADAEARQLKFEQDTEAFEASREEIRKLKQEVQRLSASERRYQGVEMKLQMAFEEAAQAESRAEKRLLAITARETQLLAEQKAHESQIAALKRQLAEAGQTDKEEREKQTNGAKENGVAPIYEASLRNMQTRYAELQKQYGMLKRKYGVAQASLLDLRCDMEERRDDVSWPTQREMARTKSADAGAGTSPGAGAPVGLGIRTRSQQRERGLSDPEIQPIAGVLAGTSFNATAPLPASPVLGKAGELGFQYHSRPSSGPGEGVVGAGAAAGGAASDGQGQPQRRTGSTGGGGERMFYGRGGVQNNLRKEKKGDGKKEEKDKKEKRPGVSLIRGLRNLS